MNGVIHLPMPVNADGDGPEDDPTKVARIICWECTPAETWPCEASGGRVNGLNGAVGAGGAGEEFEARKTPRKRHLTIDIPAPCDFINSNQRLHRMAQAKLTKTWRQASATAAHGLEPFTTQVHITAHIFKPRGGRWDPNNLWPTVKAAVDGLVDAGLLADDDHKHLIGPDMRAGGRGNPEIVLEIIETGASE